MPCKQVVSTPSVALEPINYGASTSSMISQFYAENNVNVEETKQYTEMQPKTVQQLEYPQNHSFAEVIITITISNYSISNIVIFLSYNTFIRFRG